MSAPPRRLQRLVGTLRTGPERARRGDAGASLIFVLIFLLVGGLIVGGLADAAASDLGNTVTFKAARMLDADVSNAIDVALQDIRYMPLLSPQPSGTLNASPPAACWATTPAGPSVVDNTDGNDIAVWCTTTWTPTSTATRVVTLSACRSTVAAATCAANPLAQEVVTFDDYPAGLSAPSQSACSVYCGSGMTVDSYVRNPVLPTVTGLSRSSEPDTTGGTLVTITGTGFVSGSTVDFVEESGGDPSTDNVVLAAKNVTYLSPTSIEVATPAIIAGTTYYVTVTTPTGTTAYSGNDIFAYTRQIPMVTSLTTTEGGGDSCSSIPGDPAGVTACGSTAGGTAVTIAGSGFTSNDTVDFVADPGGTSIAVNPAYVTVDSSTSITVVSPPITAGSTYYVTVTDTGVGTSATSALFWYFGIVPTVSSISPSGGMAGTTLTITGTGFFTGATVEFFPESGGQEQGDTSFAGTSVTVVSATSITVKSPTNTTKGTTFFVLVTTPAGTSGVPSVVYTY